MRLSVIDLGTNSVRFDVHQIGPGKRIRQLHREKIMVRLGQGVFVSGKLDRSAVQRALHAFRRFKRVSDQLKVNKIVAFGTSALREVSDRQKFVKTIQAATGIRIRVISGAEEAQLIALGVLSQEKVRKERFALVDIGGGSTEVSICRGRTVHHSASFALGTARLQQLYLKKSPPARASVGELRQFIRGTLLSQPWIKEGKAKRILASSGTVKALARLLGHSEKGTIERSELGELIDEMSGMTTTELLGISGMESKRVDMILAGAILFHEIMEVMGVKKASTTEFSLRDGILEEELRLHEEGGTSHLVLHLPDLKEKAMQFGADEKHLKRSVELAETLFARLRSVHRLSDDRKIYLIAAMILRKTGESIAYAGRGEHSYYIVKNAEFQAAESWETELIAQLCRYHEETRLQQLFDLPFGKTRARRDSFLRLLALLQVADALDPGHETHLRIRKVKVAGKKVEIGFGGRGLTGLETVNVEKRAPFFQKVFRKNVVATPAR